MRYLIAIAISLTIIGVVSLYANHVQHSLNQRIQEELKKLKQSGKIPEDYNGSDFGMELPGIEVVQIKLVDLWIRFRVAFIPIMLIASLVVARMLEPSVPLQPTQPVSPTQN